MIWTAWIGVAPNEVRELSDRGTWVCCGDEGGARIPIGKKTNATTGRRKQGEIGNGHSHEREWLGRVGSAWQVFCVRCGLTKSVMQAKIICTWDPFSSTSVSPPTPTTPSLLGISYSTTYIHRVFSSSEILQSTNQWPNPGRNSVTWTTATGPKQEYAKLQTLIINDPIQEEPPYCWLKPL